MIFATTEAVPTVLAIITSQSTAPRALQSLRRKSHVFFSGGSLCHIAVLFLVNQEDTNDMSGPSRGHDV